MPTDSSPPTRKLPEWAGDLIAVLYGFGTMGIFIIFVVFIALDPKSGTDWLLLAMLVNFLFWLCAIIAVALGSWLLSGKKRKPDVEEELPTKEEPPTEEKRSLSLDLDIK